MPSSTPRKVRADSSATNDDRTSTPLSVSITLCIGTFFGTRTSTSASPSLIRSARLDSVSISKLNGGNCPRRTRGRRGGGEPATQAGDQRRREQHDAHPNRHGHVPHDEPPGRGRMSECHRRATPGDVTTVVPANADHRRRHSAFTSTGTAAGRQGTLASLRSQAPRLLERLAQRPRRPAPSPRRWSDPVADVTTAPHERMVRRRTAIPQHLPVLDDPAMGAAWIGEQPTDPGSEPARRHRLIGRRKSEPVLVHARAPLDVCLEPAGVVAPRPVRRAHRSAHQTTATAPASLPSLPAPRARSTRDRRGETLGDTSSRRPHTERRQAHHVDLKGT